MPWDDILRDDYGPEVLPSAEVNTHSKVIGAQVEGGLEAHGAGIVGGDDFEVTAGTGLSVDIAAGKAVVETSAGKVFIEAATGYNLSGLDASSTVYVYAGAQLRVAAEDPDSREDAEVLYTSNTTGGDLVDYVLLAEVVTGLSGVISVTDARVFIKAQQAMEAVEAFEGATDAIEADVAGIKTVIGDGYYDESGDPVGGEDSVHDRLTTLESGGVGGGATVYWGALERASADRTTIAEFVASQLGGGGGEESGGDAVEATVVQLPSDEEICNHLLLLMRGEHVLPGIAETQEGVCVWVPGISSDDLYDAVETTAPIDETYHTVG